MVSNPAAVGVMGSARAAMTSMVIDGHLPQGYVVVCRTESHDHSFLAKRLGPSVECPLCGHTALSSDLVAAFYTDRSRSRAA